MGAILSHNQVQTATYDAATDPALGAVGTVRLGTFFPANGFEYMIAVKITTDLASSGDTTISFGYRTPDGGGVINKFLVATAFDDLNTAGGVTSVFAVPVKINSPFELIMGIGTDALDDGALQVALYYTELNF